MSKKCGCEGSCPVCFEGEVSDHHCNRCGRDFCPTCHGIKRGPPSEDILKCACRPEDVVLTN
ncbi:MAG: hypothetical protein V4467_03600 [Patescibacteria group bacterium]